MHVRKRTIAAEGIEGLYCVGDAGQRRQAIVLLAGSQGGFFSAGYPEFLESLVAIGYTVLDLAYFRQGALPRQLRKIPLEYFKRAFNWLSNQPEVEPDNYIVMGASKGGELALLLGSRFEEVRGVIALVPSHVVFQAIGLPHVAGSSWTYRGEDVPFVSFAPMPWLVAGILAPLTRGYKHLYIESLKRIHDDSKAIIPVERIGGPVLLISATEDRMWPSEQMCQAITTRLTENGFQHPYEHQVIEGPHWILSSRVCREAVFTFLAAHFGTRVPTEGQNGMGRDRIKGVDGL